MHWLFGILEAANIRASCTPFDVDLPVSMEERLVSEHETRSASWMVVSSIEVNRSRTRKDVGLNAPFFQTFSVIHDSTRR
jgi:hypothetical protein